MMSYLPVSPVLSTMGRWSWFDKMLMRDPNCIAWPVNLPLPKITEFLPVDSSGLDSCSLEPFLAMTSS